MLSSVNKPYDYVLDATDDLIGRRRDFLFDYKLWINRHIEADSEK